MFTIHHGRIWFPRNNSTEHGYHDAVDILCVKAVVRRRHLEGDGSVVHSPQHESIVEVIKLSLAVRRVGFRIGYFEHTPRLTVLLVWINFSTLNTRPAEVEGKCEIVVEGITAKGKEMQVVPRCRSSMVRECIVRVVSRSCDDAISTFDPYALWGVDPTVISIAVAQALPNDLRGFRIDGAYRLSVSWISLPHERRTGQVETHFNGSNVVPAFGAAVCIDDKSCQIRTIAFERSKFSKRCIVPTF